MELAAYDAWADDLHLDSGAREFARQDLSERDEERLGRRVNRSLRQVRGAR